MLFSLAVFLPVLAVLALAGYFSARANIPIGYFTRDPAQTLGYPPYIGLVSYVGMLLWSAAAAVCFFTSLVVRRRGHELELSRFLFFSGLLTSYLLLDDLFLFHDRVFPHYLGVDEKFLFPAYMVIVALLGWRFRRLILETDLALLALAVFLFGVAIALDALPAFYPTDQWASYHLFEDGFKLLGITGWFAYFARVCYRALQVSTASLNRTRLT